MNSRFFFRATLVGVQIFGRWKMVGSIMPTSGQTGRAFRRNPIRRGTCLVSSYVTVIFMSLFWPAWSLSLVFLIRYSEAFGNEVGFRSMVPRSV